MRSLEQDRLLATPDFKRNWAALVSNTHNIYENLYLPEYEILRKRINPKTMLHEAAIQGAVQESAYLKVAAGDLRLKAYLMGLLPMGEPANAVYAAGLEGSALQRNPVILSVNHPEHTQLTLKMSVAEIIRPLFKVDTEWKKYLYGLGLLSNFRIFQMLKHLGLLTRDPATTRLLGLGTAEGLYERFGFQIKAGPRTIRPDIYVLGTEYDEVKEVTFVDINPNLQNFEADFSASVLKPLGITTNSNILVSDARAAMRQFAQRKQADLVMCLRFAPEMVGKVSDFFSYISQVIAPNADFIASIGSGNDPGEWNKRKQKLDEIERYLRKKGHTPVLLDMTVNGQEDQPLWGWVGITHQKVLYC